MKQFRQLLDFSFLVICVLLILSSVISVRGEDVPKGGPSKPMPTEPEGYELIGTVVDATQQFSQENLAALAASKSFEDFFRVLKGMLLRRPAANVAVTAKGVSVTRKVVTDSQGKFKFIGLPREHYEISAEMPSRFFGTGEKRMATARIPFRFDRAAWVYLELRTDLVTVKGRITDSQGQPIAGAKVSGEPYADLTSEREMGFPTRFAVSGADGSYELSGLVPSDITEIASYLWGYDPIYSQDPFYVAVCIEAAGFMQDTEKAPRVPLVTEELLGPARRYLKIMNNLDTLLKRNSDYVEKKDVYLPSSQGNTITGIDIVLKKAGETGP